MILASKRRTNKISRTKIIRGIKIRIQVEELKCTFIWGLERQQLLKNECCL